MTLYLLEVLRWLSEFLFLKTFEILKILFQIVKLFVFSKKKYFLVT